MSVVLITDIVKTIQVITILLCHYYNKHNLIEQLNKNDYYNTALQLIVLNISTVVLTDAGLVNVTDDCMLLEMHQYNAKYM